MELRGMTNNVIVFGAGLAGLSAARHLGGAEVFERSTHVGGHAHTKREGGFCFD